MPSAGLLFWAWSGIPVTAATYWPLTAHGQTVSPRPGGPGTLDTARLSPGSTSSPAGEFGEPPPPGATMTQLPAVNDPRPDGLDCGIESAGADEHPQTTAAHAARTPRRRIIRKSPPIVWAQAVNRCRGMVSSGPLAALLIYGA